MEQLFDGKTPENSPVAIASLTKAVAAITEKLGTLLKQQGASPATDGDVTGSISPIITQHPAALPLLVEPEAVEPKIEKLLPPTSPQPTQIQESEVQMLKNIYRDELQVLKQIVLDNDGGRKEASKAVVPNTETKPVVKSGPSKLYEALGNFAGSLLKSARRTPKAKEEDNIYETVKIEREQKPMPAPSTSNEVLAALLQEKLVSKSPLLPSATTLYKPLPPPPLEPEPPLSSGSDSSEEDQGQVHSSSSASERSQPRKALNEILAQLSHGKSSLDSSEEEELVLEGESEGESSGDIEEDEDESYGEEEEEAEDNSNSNSNSEENVNADGEQTYEEMELNKGQVPVADLSPSISGASCSPETSKAKTLKQITQPEPEVSE
jgi:hypothetical protein